VVKYAITFATSARKELENLETTFVEKIFPRIEELANEPRPRGCKKLEGEENLWRIRVGDYRVVYHIYDKQNIVDIVHIRHRKDAYRN